MGSKGRFLWGQLSWAAVLLANGLINTHDVTMCVHGYQLVLRGGQCTKEDAMMAAFMPPSSCAGNERNENLVEGGVGVLVNVCVCACVCVGGCCLDAETCRESSNVACVNFCCWNLLKYILWLGEKPNLQPALISHVATESCRPRFSPRPLAHHTHIHTHTEKERPAWAEVDSHAGNIKNYSFLFLHFL